MNARRFAMCVSASVRASSSSASSRTRSAFSTRTSASEVPSWMTAFQPSTANGSARPPDSSRYSVSAAVATSAPPIESAMPPRSVTNQVQKPIGARYSRMSDTSVPVR